MTEPLTPADCDLRDFTWMPVDCTRLLTSETWLLASSAEKVAALTLWIKSWHQVPAASLPSNDQMLAIMSEAGAKWPKVRDHALRGWVKCADGRLYHPVVAEKARESWDRKLAQRSRTEAARAAKSQRRGAVLTETVTTPVTESVTEVVTGSNRKEQTRPDKTGSSTEVESAPTAPRAATPPTTKRGCRLPEDWQPDEPTFGGVNPDQVLPKFRDYWRAASGANAVKADWQATWRNWCRREGGSVQPTAQPRKSSQMSVPDQDAELMRLMQAATKPTDETPNVLRLVG